MHGTQGPSYTTSQAMKHRNTGSFVYLAGIRMGEIGDGISNTIFVGEVIDAHIQESSNRWLIAGHLDSLRSTENPINTKTATGSVLNLDGYKCSGAFASRHPNGGLFVFGDGHVSFVTDNIAQAVYEALATRNGGEKSVPLLRNLQSLGEIRSLCCSISRLSCDLYASYADIYSQAGQGEASPAGVAGVRLVSDVSLDEAESSCDYLEPIVRRQAVRPAEESAIMNGISIRIALLLTLCLSSLGCQGPRHTDRGALLGGLLVRGVGAAVGDKNNNALPGALVGGAIGAVTGAAIGDSVDRDIERNRQQVAAQYQQRQAAAISPERCDQHVSGRFERGRDRRPNPCDGVSRSSNVNDLIYLRNQGVPDGAILAMQQAQLSTVVQMPPPPIDTRPVVVEHRYTPYYAPPPPVFYGHWHSWPYCPPPSHHHHHGGSRASWGFSFSR